MVGRSTWILALALAVAGLPAGSARAFDESMRPSGEQPCNDFCRTWMGLDRRPPAPVDLPLPIVPPVELAPPSIEPPPTSQPVRKRPAILRKAHRPAMPPGRDLAVVPGGAMGAPRPGSASDPGSAGPPDGARPIKTPSQAAPAPAVLPAPAPGPVGSVPEGVAGPPPDPVLRSRINWVRELNAGLGRLPVAADPAGEAERKAIEEDLKQLRPDR